MNNFFDNSLSLIGIWRSEIGLFLEINEFTRHTFKGCFLGLDSSPFNSFSKEVSGWIHQDFKTTIKLVFFCDADGPCDPLHKCAFACEVAHLNDRLYMQLHWIKYSIKRPYKVISRGSGVFNKHHNENDNLVSILLSMFSN